MLGKENPFSIDYIKPPPETYIKNIKRDRNVEEKRENLTVVLKNAVMHHLTALKIQKTKPTFLEIIQKVIEQKKKEKELVGKKRQKNLQNMMSGTKGDQIEYQSINYEQANHISQMLQVVKQKF